MAGENGLSLRKTGSSETGFAVELLFNGESVARHRDGGEFSLGIENSIHNITEELPNWTSQRFRTDESGKTAELSGSILLEKVGLHADVHIEYAVINPNVVRKTISLTHRFGPRVYYRLTNALESIHPPAKMWSFLQEDNREGGTIREPYPAVGFETANGLVVGLLTHNGVENRWTRANTMFHLDSSKGLVEIERVPDEDLTYLATTRERLEGDFFVAFYFGRYHLHDVKRNGKPVIEAYHPLMPGGRDSKTLIIFVDESKGHRQTMVACQTRLAEGLGFIGSREEKILWADVQMLTWIDEPGSFMAYPSPSIGYQFLYQRDAFWMVAAQLDKRIAEQTWELVRYTQDDTGGVCCHYIPYRFHAGMPGGQTDANMHWLIWAYINLRRYRSAPDIDAIKKNLDWTRANFCTRNDGEYLTRSAGWFDVFKLDDPVMVSHMQGEFAVTLRCARELGMPVTEGEIEAAENRYRACYDSSRGFMPFGETDRFRELLSPTVLMPEFLSLWLFNKPILGDHEVNSTLDSIDRAWDKRRAEGFATPNIITEDGRFQSKESKVFAPVLWWEPGIYHNGGSWLLYEYLAYVAGHLHGWKPETVGASALERMEKRLHLEFSEEHQPVSHEYLPLTAAIDTPGSVWDGRSDDGIPGPPGSKVFGWNAFIIIANEVAGIRPAHDPIVVEHRTNEP